MTPTELDKLLAQKVCGWTYREHWVKDIDECWWGWFDADGSEQWGGADPPKFSTSADAVLPWIAPYNWCYAFGSVCIHSDPMGFVSAREATTLAMALTIALLRTNGVEIDLKETP